MITISLQSLALAAIHIIEADVYSTALIVVGDSQVWTDEFKFNGTTIWIVAPNRQLVSHRSSNSVHFTIVDDLLAIYDCSIPIRLTADFQHAFWRQFYSNVVWSRYRNPTSQPVLKRWLLWVRNCSHISLRYPARIVGVLTKIINTDPSVCRMCGKHPVSIHQISLLNAFCLVGAALRVIPRMNSLTCSCDNFTEI